MIGDHPKASEHWRTFLRDFTQPDAAYAAMREEAEREIRELEREVARGS